jgi:hypothetical protein
MIDLRHRSGLQIAQCDLGIWVQFLDVDRNFARKFFTVAISAGRAIDGDLVAGGPSAGSSPLTSLILGARPSRSLSAIPSLRWHMLADVDFNGQSKFHRRTN